MRLQFLLILLIIGCNHSIAQSNIKMLNAMDIKPDKYKDYTGSPYLWEENQEVIVYDTGAKEYESMTGNYNTLDEEFEIYQDGKFIQLPHASYPLINVVKDGETTTTLVSNAHSKLNNKYCTQYVKTANYSVLENVASKKSDVEVQTPGKATIFKKINPRTTYYLLYGSELTEIKINKKKLIKQFGHKKEIDAFLNENKMKINEMGDVLVVFEFLDSKGWLKSPE